MEKLESAYTDIKNVKHRVEHLLVAESSEKNREQILEELYFALTRKKQQNPV